MNLVIDASITLAWIYDDERTQAVERAFAVVVDDGAWVPTIWHLEVANGLQRAIRQRRIDVAYRQGALADLLQLEIAVDFETNLFAWNDTVALADRFGLTLYDASYLELAERRRLPIATLDTSLRRAAEALAIATLGV